MTEKQLDKIRTFIADNIGEFHAAVLASVRKKDLNFFLRRCNPYLFKAKARENAGDFVKRLLENYLRKSEETHFGKFLESVAVFVSKMLHDGHKSVVSDMDLEFDRDGTHYVVSVKSGPNWGNSGQQQHLKTRFLASRKIAGQAGAKNKVEFVLGHCYGRKGNPSQGSHLRYSGQEFWRFLSGDDSLYLRIIEPLGNQAKRRNQEFADAYDQMLNQLTQEFMERFCVGGKIQWEEVVKFNSGKERPKPPPKRARKKG